MRSTLLAIAVLSTASCGGSPSGPTPVCRRYAATYTANGTPYRCVFAEGSALLSCNSGTALTNDWQYNTSGDFVDEAQVPHRLRVRTRTFNALGMVTTSRTFLTEYRYDSAGRPISRQRTNNYSFGSFALDTLEYTAWDVLGRPTAGTMHVGDRSGPLTISYNDSAREVEASNGESVTLDQDGNVTRETVASGFGDSGQAVVEYVVQSTAQVCK